MPKRIRHQVGGHYFNNYIDEMQEKLLNAAMILQDFAKDERDSLKRDQALKLAEVGLDLNTCAILLTKIKDIAQADTSTDPKVLDYPKSRVVGGSDE